LELVKFMPSSRKSPEAFAGCRNAQKPQVAPESLLARR
jgi:hypothetical protein